METKLVLLTASTFLCVKFLHFSFFRYFPPMMAGYYDEWPGILTCYCLNTLVYNQLH